MSTNDSTLFTVTYLKNDKKYKCKNTNQMAIIFSASRLDAYLGAILAPGSKLLSNYWKGAIAVLQYMYCLQFRNQNMKQPT